MVCSPAKIRDAEAAERLRRFAIVYTIWMAFWAPLVLWSYGPQNFFWLCNLAKWLILVGVWTGNRLLLSAQAGTLLVVGIVWTPDFLLGLVSGGAWANFTGYMFDPELPRLARTTSLYHILLPPLLVWVIWRIGYDRRAPYFQSALAALALPATYIFTDPERNINWLVEPMGVEQVWVPEPVFLILMMALYPLLLFLPGHGLMLLILRLLGKR